ncbi:hypothetical protein NHF46_14795 [Arthrobacter alpinus]|nr:hypothetical protein [Arthrobacter alpinus]
MRRFKSVFNTEQSTSEMVLAHCVPTDGRKAAKIVIEMTVQITATAANPRSCFVSAGLLRNHASNVSGNFPDNRSEGAAKTPRTAPEGAVDTGLSPGSLLCSCGFHFAS